VRAFTAIVIRSATSLGASSVRPRRSAAQPGSTKCACGRS